MPVPKPDPLRRLLLAALGSVLAGLSPIVARAGDEDDEDDDDDDSGRGRGRGGDDEDEDDDEDDNSGHGGGDDDDDDDDNSGPGGGGEDDDDDNSGPGGGDARDRDDRIRDIEVRYSDGWIERIVGGDYVLIDNLQRLVIRRRATTEDYARMRALY